MAISQQELIAAGVGATVIGGAILLSRRPSAPEFAFAVTGPSEVTARELVRANVEFARIEASREVDLSDIFTTGLVGITRIESQERIVGMELRTRERISTEENLTAREIAKIREATQRLAITSREQTQQAAVATQKQKGLFDFIIDIAGLIFPFFKK